ncbi:Hypothetical predicted protein [Octopus vulgaris]|uniref:Uncharacterized protein n=1 Tax=Octopus vulgaris TaxID=6645 RepID=A0AA36BBP5_OCTVU|nr:Hypothetical predicted protein [Octopus vulgaris]
MPNIQHILRAKQFVGSALQDGSSDHQILRGSLSNGKTYAPSIEFRKEDGEDKEIRNSIGAMTGRIFLIHYFKHVIFVKSFSAMVAIRNPMRLKEFNQALDRSNALSDLIQRVNVVFLSENMTSLVQPMD